MNYATLEIGNSLLKLQEKIKIHLEHVDKLQREAVVVNTDGPDTVSPHLRFWIPSVNKRTTGTNLYNQFLNIQPDTLLKAYQENGADVISDISKDFAALNDDTVEQIAKKYNPLFSAPDLDR